MRPHSSHLIQTSHIHCTTFNIFGILSERTVSDEMCLCHQLSVLYDRKISSSSVIVEQSKWVDRSECSSRLETVQVSLSEKREASWNVECCHTTANQGRGPWILTSHPFLGRCWMIVGRQVARASDTLVIKKNLVA